MPKIISPPKTKPETEPIITTCPHCQYTISYTEDEVERVDDEYMGVYCPQCGGAIETKRIKPFTFPDSFYQYGVSEDAVEISNEKIQEYINIVRRELEQECEAGGHSFTGSGDTMVFGFKFEDEYVIYVAKNYWEDSIAR